MYYQSSPFSKVFFIFFIILILSGMVLGLYFGGADLLNPQLAIKPTPDGNLLAVQSDVIKLQNEVKSLQQGIDALSQTPPDASMYSELSQMQSRVDSIDMRLQAIEQTILDNPSKALEVTMLHRDIENIQQNRISDLQAIQEEINRIYDLTKWIVGLMFTMAIGLLGIAVGNFFTKPVKQEEKTIKEKQNAG